MLAFFNFTYYTNLTYYCYLHINFKKIYYINFIDEYYLINQNLTIQLGNYNTTNDTSLNNPND